MKLFFAMTMSALVLLSAATIAKPSTIEISRSKYPKQWCFRFETGSVFYNGTDKAFLVLVPLEQAATNKNRKMCEGVKFITFALDKASDSRIQRNGKYFDCCDDYRTVVTDMNKLKFFLDLAKKTK